MTPIAPRRTRRRIALATSILAVLAVLVSTFSAPALAEPPKPPNEGGTPTLATLRQNLEAAAGGYLKAQAALEVSQKKQTELNAELAKAELDLTGLRKLVGHYAAEAYKTGRLGAISLMMNSRTSDSFLKKANALDKITQRDQARLSSLLTVQRRATEAKAGIDAEVKAQTVLLNEMAKRKTAAERALSAFGGRKTTGYIDPRSPIAKPAPRNPDGSWPRESCSINDPTTSGCITPRTLHSMNQAKAVGFNHYVSCHRSGGSGEHPKGRACDYAANDTGFANVNASGADRNYGDRLASFFVKNAGRLGVLYVIWYCKIWVNGGWKSYSSTGSRCGDSPAGDHTNHVHVSIY